ncbi:MAG: gamma-glutamyl-gamma-aminobutyrate hydrolase family protein [Planctomycetota bacterium]|nr:MAG: gamma-glutamyl-gamma-aminobutyrate hydrolase family protein [Planctomycetota bacterium]
MNHHKPRIAISTEFELLQRPFGKRYTSFLYEPYYQALQKAGAFVITLPPLPCPEDIQHLNGIVDGLVLSGGDDLPPQLYHQQPLPQANLTPIHPKRQKTEFALLQWAEEQKIPTLGICLGAQVINVHRNGTLWQDIQTQIPHALCHRKPKEPTFHPIQVSTQSKLYQILQTTQLTVNSYHHQAIQKLGTNLQAAAKAPDGVVEAIEASDHPFLVGIQWHLELDQEKLPYNQKILEYFVEFVRQYSLTKTII